MPLDLRGPKGFLKTGLLKTGSSLVFEVGTWGLFSEEATLVVVEELADFSSNGTVEDPVSTNGSGVATMIDRSQFEAGWGIFDQRAF